MSISLLAKVIACVRSLRNFSTTGTTTTATSYVGGGTGTSSAKAISRVVVVRDEMWTTESGIFVVMDLAEGGRLLDRVKGFAGPISETELRYYTLQMVDGLQMCHSRGMSLTNLHPNVSGLNWIFYE